jgi:hypothetical protein
VLGHVGDGERDRTAAGLVRHIAPEPSQQLGHDADVEDVGNVDQRRRPLRQQPSRHELEHAVLRPRHADTADEPGTADDPECLHGRRW